MENGTVPEAWKRSRVTLIHKGNGKPKEKIENYRPIAVMNVMAKVFGTVINEKLKRWAEENKVWGEEQAGFRKGRGGLENIVFVMRDIIEKYKKSGKGLYLVFLDIEKAYDTVDRQRLFSLLKHIGMDCKVVKVLEDFYKNNEVKFTLGTVNTGWIKNNVGVRQGCVMSPTLFNIYLEELLTRIRVSGRATEI